MSIQCKNIFKSFSTQSPPVIKDVSFTIHSGEFVSISGRSGSGKSTLLYILSTLDSPTKGIIEIDNLDVYNMTQKQIHQFRNKNVGFIFQFHYLLPELSAIENVLLGPRNLGLANQYKEKAFKLLEHLEVSDQAHKLPSQMSGGQQQRVAIARSLILDPKYIFADEPTGNLDTKNAEKVMKTLRSVNLDKGTTIILVTHEPTFSKLADREIVLVDGQLSSQFV